MWGNQGGYDQSGYGDNAGGYLSSQTAGGSSSQQTSQKRQRAQNIIPCTVAQIVKAEQVDDKFVSDNIDLHQVTLVGLVREAKESATNLMYMVDDMTGPMLEVRQFVDNDENTPDAERTVLIRENIYIQAHGHVRSFGGKRNVTAFRITPVTDMNEVTSHILEVIYAHACLTKAPQSMDTSTSATSAAKPQQGNPQPSTFVNPTHANDNTNNGYGQNDLGLSTQQYQVLNVIRSCMDDQGLSVSTVLGRLNGMPRKVIEESIEFLSSEGHIYSTIDDEHYKATDSL